MKYKKNLFRKNIKNLKAQNLQETKDFLNSVLYMKNEV